jgi:hypothetical protein
MDTSGFYTFDQETQEGIYAPNFVYAKDYELHRELHDTYTYPVHGWYWFDRLFDAQMFYQTDYNFDITPQAL